MSKELLKETRKSNKCDYCDEFATFKFDEGGIYTYLCKSCLNERKRKND